MNIKDSILKSIKKLLGISPDYAHFDPDIIMYINSAFMVLTQIGVGPPNGYAIEDDKDQWDDFIDKEEERLKLQSIQSYVYLKVKMVFDPPTSTAVLESMNNMIKELEWRLNVAADKEEIQNE